MLRISREIFEAKNYESSDVINYVLIIALRVDMYREMTFCSLLRCKVNKDIDV